MQKKLVVSSAIDASNPEIAYCKKHKIPIVHRSEFLAELMSNHKRSIAVSGSHGKTTTSAMISHVLYKMNVDPSFAIVENIIT